MSLTQPLRHAGERRLSGPLRHVGLLVPLAVAIVDFSWRLGSSSLFVDEVYSWRAAHVSLGTLLHRVHVDEIAPPGYYLLLHAWIRVFGSDSESVLRALSVVAGVGTVAAVYWVATLLAGRLVAFIAALFAAVSPLVLEYAQEVRAYGCTMLAVTIAVGATLQSEVDRSRQNRWLTLAAAAAVVSLWLHYSAVLVIAPLLVFVVVRREISSRARRWFAGAVLAGGAAVLPFAISQFALGKGNAVAAISHFTWFNLRRVIGSPFDRTYPGLSAAHLTIGAAVVAIALALCLLPRARRRIAHPRLLVALAGAPPLALIVLTLIGPQILLSRYDAVAVPFMVIAIASAIATFPPAGVAVVAVALYIAAPESRVDHNADHAYPNTRAAVRFVAREWTPREVLFIGPGYQGLGYNLQYYATRLLPRGARVGYNAGLALLGTVLTDRALQIDRVALISAPFGSRQQIEGNLARAHWRLLGIEQITGAVPMQALVAARGT